MLERLEKDKGQYAPERLHRVRIEFDVEGRYTLDV